MAGNEQATLPPTVLLWYTISIEDVYGCEQLKGLLRYALLSKEGNMFPVGQSASPSSLFL